MTITFDSIVVYLLVFLRMGGMLLLNPVFNRRNVPARVRVALVLLLTLVVAPTLEPPPVQDWNGLVLVGAMAMEFFVGFLLSFVFQLFYYMLFFAGDLLDVEFGLSMARVFDPGSNIQMAVSSNLLNIIFMLYLFVTDSHLILIRLFASSYEVLPVGTAQFTAQPASFYISLAGEVFSLAVRLTLPFVAAVFVSEIAMGVLMKLVPQIHVFVISIQFKILIGMVLLFLFAAPLGNFIDNYMQAMFENMERALLTLRQPG